MIFQARFGYAQTNLGLQFVADDGTLLGTRQTTGISAGQEVGHYIAIVATVPAGSVSVYWDSDTDEATEDLRDALAIAELNNLSADEVRTELATELGRIDVAVSTRNATAPDNAGVAAIKAKTDLIPASPASTGDCQTGAAAALTAYDPPTRAEATADKQAIIDRGDAAWITGGGGSGGGGDATEANQLLILNAISGSTITVVSQVAQSGNAITVRAGDTWSIQLAGLGTLTDADSLVFAVKTKSTDADEDALLLIDLDGLQTLLGTAHDTAADGSLTITDSAAGDVTIAVNATASEAMGQQYSVTWALKKISSAGVARTLATGKFKAEESVIDQTN